MLLAEDTHHRSEVEQFYPALLRIARQHLPSHEVEDAVQETIARFLDKVGHDETIQDPTKYIQGILYNVIREFQKRRKKQSGEPITDPPDPDPTIEDQIEQDNLCEVIQKSLATLEPFYQKLIRSHVIEGKTFKQLEAIFHKPHSTLHRVFLKGMKIFARVLERNGIKE